MNERVPVWVIGGMIPTQKTKVLGENVGPLPVVHHSSHMDCRNNGSDKETKELVNREFFCSSVGGLIHTRTVNVGMY
jgi:hypothetical protein